MNILYSHIPSHISFYNSSLNSNQALIAFAPWLSSLLLDFNCFYNVASAWICLDSFRFLNVKIRVCYPFCKHVSHSYLPLSSSICHMCVRAFAFPPTCVASLFQSSRYLPCFPHPRGHKTVYLVCANREMHNLRQRIPYGLLVTMFNVKGPRSLKPAPETDKHKKK